MNIEYSKNRFVITCNFSENHLVKSIPNVRFDRRNKRWVAQNLRGNCDYLIKHLSGYLDDESRAVCEKTLQKTKAVYKPFPAWYSFKTDPYEKQKEALDYTYNLRRSALFMGMGSGKSKTAIDKFSCHFMENAIDCWVIMCPLNVKPVWYRKQLPEHMPIDVPVFFLAEGDAKKSAKQVQEMKQCDRFVLIVGIESLKVGKKTGSAYVAVRDAIINRKYGVTLDESHFCKSHDSNTSHNISHLCAGAEIMNIMTGTPMSLGFIDLYMQFEILDPNILGFGSYYAFRDRYAIMGGFEDRKVVDYQNIDELMDLITPFTYQCTKEEMVDLPPKIPEPVYLQMAPEQVKAYKKIDEDMTIKLPKNGTDREIEVYVEQAMVKYGVLQQIVGGFINYDDEENPIVIRGKDGEVTTKYKRKAEILVPIHRNPKIKDLVRLAKEHNDKQIIVWAKYRTEISMVVEALETEFGHGCCSEYHGGVPKGEERDEQERRFLDGETRFMVSNQKTGGTGTTWVVSTLTYYYSNDSRFIDREQSEDRNHRIGQDKSVIYVDAIMEGTVDEDLLAAIAERKDLSEYLKEGIAKRLLTRTP